MMRVLLLCESRRPLDTSHRADIARSVELIHGILHGVWKRIKLTNTCKKICPYLAFLRCKEESLYKQILLSLSSGLI